MQNAVIVKGRFDGEKFIADGPLPTSVGAAQLVIIPESPAPRRHSIAEAIGKGTLNEEQMNARLKEVRDSWGES